MKVTTWILKDGKPTKCEKTIDTNIVMAMKANLEGKTQGTTIG